MMKKYLLFLVVAVLFLGCEDKQKSNVPEGMSDSKKEKKKSVREPIRFDHHK